MGYPTLYSRPDSAVVATLAARFPTVSHPRRGSKSGVIFDIRSGQARFFVGFGLTLALGTTSVWCGLANAIFTTRFGGRGDARRPFLDRFAPNNEAEHSTFSDVFQRWVGFGLPLWDGWAPICSSNDEYMVWAIQRYIDDPIRRS